MCVFATLPWDDLNTALHVAVETCIKIGVSGVHRVLLDPAAVLEPSKCDVDQLVAESRATDAHLSDVVADLAKKSQTEMIDVGSDPEVIGAGTAALNRYGIGPCSARWFYGSFDVFLSLEQRLARLYPSLQHLHGTCRGRHRSF